MKYTVNKICFGSICCKMRMWKWKWLQEYVGRAGGWGIKNNCDANNNSCATLRAQGVWGETLCRRATWCLHLQGGPLYSIDKVTRTVRNFGNIWPSDTASRLQLFVQCAVWQWAVSFVHQIVATGHMLWFYVLAILIHILTLYSVNIVRSQSLSFSWLLCQTACQHMSEILLCSALVWVLSEELNLKVLRQ
jgi:hypothetical protein